MITVTVKCVGCGSKKEIYPKEVAKDDVPMCDQCFMPMVAERAKHVDFVKEINGEYHCNMPSAKAQKL